MFSVKCKTRNSNLGIQIQNEVRWLEVRDKMIPVTRELAPAPGCFHLLLFWGQRAWQIALRSALPCPELPAEATGLLQRCTCTQCLLVPLCKLPSVSESRHLRKAASVTVWASSTSASDRNGQEFPTCVLLDLNEYWVWSPLYHFGLLPKTKSTVKS